MNFAHKQFHKQLNKPITIMVFALLCWLLLLVLPGTALAAPQVTLEQQGTAQANYLPGDSFTVSVCLSAPEACSFGSFQTDLVYDAQRLSLVQVGSLAAGYTLNSAYAQDTLRLVYAPGSTALALAAAPIKIAELTFVVKEDAAQGTAALAPANPLFFDAGDSGEVAAQGNGLQVAVAISTAPRVTLLPAGAAPWSYASGQTFVIDVWLSAPQACSYGSFQTDLVYDAQRLSLVQAGSLAAGYTLNSAYAQDTLRLIYGPSSTALTLSATPVKVAELTFMVKADAALGEAVLAPANPLFFLAGDSQEVAGKSIGCTVLVQQSSLHLSITGNSGQITVNVSGLEQSAKLLVAAYSQQGRMLYTGMAVLPSAPEQISRQFAGVDGAVRWRAFLLDTDHWQPLAPAAELIL